MHDRELTKVDDKEIKEALKGISDLAEDRELSQAILLQRQLKFYYQTRKELRDSCCFIDVHIQSGNKEFTKKNELMIDNLIYYIRDNQLHICTYKEETMMIENQYFYSRYAHPLLIQKWYKHLNRQHYFDSMRNFLIFYKFDEIEI